MSVHIGNGGGQPVRSRPASAPDTSVLARGGKRDLLAGAWELHDAVPDELGVPVGKRRSEGGQEALDVAFAGVDEGSEGVVVNGRGSGLAVVLVLVLESGDVDDSAATKSLSVLVGGRNGCCGRQLRSQTDGHVVAAECSSLCSVGGEVVLLVSHTVVGESRVELSTGGGGSAVGVLDGGSIGNLLGTIVAINRNIFVVRSLGFIWNIRVCG